MARLIYNGTKLLKGRSVNFKLTVRCLTNKVLYYSQFGDPCCVVKYLECPVRRIGDTDVLVKMLASPVNPVDINTIQGKTYYVPNLPTTAGDEGVGQVVEIGPLVSRVKPGQRVIISSRLQGAWQSHGVYDERDLHVVPHRLPIPEAAMLAVAPVRACRMIQDFHPVTYGQTVIQNSANNTTGQSVIQMCRAMGINTINIVNPCTNFNGVRNHLLSLGATCVYSLDQMERMGNNFVTSVDRPVLALNCACGRDEDVLLNVLAHRGAIVYYGCAVDLPFTKKCARPDVSFHRFDLNHWEMTTTDYIKSVTLNYVIQLMVTGKFVAPYYQTVELKDYTYAFKNTAYCEAYGTTNYLFDFTLPI